MSRFVAPDLAALGDVPSVVAVDFEAIKQGRDAFLIAALARNGIEYDVSSLETDPLVIAYSEGGGYQEMNFRQRVNEAIRGLSLATAVGGDLDHIGATYPITEIQFNSMCRKIGELCLKYGIEVGPKTVLSHAEVERTLGIKQRGKWDIAVLPFAGLTTATTCGDLMRRRASLYMLGRAVHGATPAAKPVTADERIAWLQRLLDGLGFHPGPIDGAEGPKTRAAVVAFQKSAGIAPNGLFDPATVAALRAKAGAK